MPFSDIRLLIFCAFAIAGVVSAIINWRRRVAARNWPLVVGRVEHTDFKYFGEYFLPVVRYSYEVDGEFYSGQHEFSEKRGNPDQALEVVAPWRKRKIFVRYNPDDSQKSVFLPKDPLPP